MDTAMPSMPWAARRPAHDYNFLSAMFEKHRPGIESALAAVGARLKPLSDAIAALRVLEGTVAVRRSELCAEIGEHIEAHVEALRRRQAQLTTQCEAVAAQKVDRIVAQQEALQSELAAMRASYVEASGALERGACR